MNHAITAEEFFGDTIYAYTRADALDDGMLVDVSETAREAGFQLPVALTRAVWADYVLVPYGLDGQDLAGRLWDILWMLGNAIRSTSTVNGTSQLAFSLMVRTRPGRPPQTVQLKAICSGGDDGEPVITVMLPGED